jgi:hypothetical protein
MQHNEPRRIVLRFHVDYELEEAAIIEDFFSMHNLELEEDYFSHLMAPNQSSMMHIVLDLHCKTFPKVQLDTIGYEVFKTKKAGEKDMLYGALFIKKVWTNHQSVPFNG